MLRLFLVISPEKSFLFWNLAHMGGGLTVRGLCCVCVSCVSERKLGGPITDLGWVNLATRTNVNSVVTLTFPLIVIQKNLSFDDSHGGGDKNIEVVFGF